MLVRTGCYHRHMGVQVDFPEEVFSALRRSPHEFVREMRLAAAIHRYEHGQICNRVALARPLVHALREAGMYLSDRVADVALALVGE